MPETKSAVSDVLTRMPSRKRLHLSKDVQELYRRRTVDKESPPSSPTPSETPGSTTPSSVSLSESPKHPRKRHSFRNAVHTHETTIFDSRQWRESTAFGLWVLFWTVTGIVSIRMLLVNLIRTGYPLTTKILQLLVQDLWKVALVDAAMYSLMWVTFFLQVLVAKGYINWSTYGWKMQHLWQAVHLLSFIAAARYLELGWIAQIFLVLHSLTMVMQQHSYAAYNAHLHEISGELELCKEALEEVPPRDKLVRLELTERVDFCQEELDMQSKKIRYPENVTAFNFFMFTMFPTLVYQLEYPRTQKIRWKYLFSKVSAIFGIYFLLIMQAEQYMYPIAIRATELRNTSVMYRLQMYPQIVLDLVPPFIVCYLLVFYLIWDAILNSIAELTYFGDRTFYRDWWNSSSWDKFARDWNVPVHNFLLRHVYFSSISFMKLSKGQATVLTFVLSALIHELAMYVIFGRIRGYLLVMQLSQLPLELICRTKFMRKRPVLGIVNFWVGICLGPSLLCSLYLTF